MRPGTLVVTVLGMALAASSAFANGAQQHPDPDVRFVTAVELTKGHLVVSRAVYETGHHARATVHAAHPVHELGVQVYGPPSRIGADLGERVRAAMKKPGQAIEAKVPAAEYAQVLARTFATLDEAVSRVVPERVRSTPTFRLAVVGELLRAVAEEYENAFAEGKIVLEVEYQDAYGFHRRAADLFHSIQPRIAADGASSISRELEALGTMLPTPTPPSAPATPARVKASVKAILDATAGLARSPGAGAPRTGGTPSR